jgi:homoserine O-acetyltransferase
MKTITCLSLLVFCLIWESAAAAVYPSPTEGDCVIKDFRFRSGETLAEVRMHYRALGEPQRGANGVVRNAVLVLHGTTGTGAQFMRADFAGELFGAGQLLDATRYYVIIPDNIGHGQSSKPSDGLHARFPRYGYLDMIEVQYRLLKVNHLRLVMGTSMGGMHSWLWGEVHPDFVDALMPLASLPTQISGRNRVWRRVIIEAIRNDPDWQNGEYTSQPRGLRIAAEMLYFMSSNPTRRFKEAPTLAQADQVLEKYVADIMATHDATDVLYAFEASQDYDPGPGLEKIQVPLLAINSADDLINPPESGILESQIKRVKHGKAIVIPEGDKTNGHGTHTLAAAWERYLAELLKQSQK